MILSDRRIALVLLDVFKAVAPEKLQVALNASEVRFAKQQVAESTTGHKIGNISPIFTGEAIPGLVTVIDAGLFRPHGTAASQSDKKEEEFVYAGVGVDGWELKLQLKDLLSAGCYVHFRLHFIFSSSELTYLLHAVVLEGNGQIVVADISTIRSHQEYETIQKQKRKGSSPPREVTAVNRANLGKGLRDLAMSSDTARLRQLLDDLKEDGRALIDNPTCNSGKTALHLAAWKGSLESVQLLLARGSNVNQWSTGSGNYGKTAIFYAMTQCRDDVVMELLDRGAWVKIVNNKGQTPRSLAVSHLKEETLQAIERAEQQQSHMEWLNFRATHSDSVVYGDLDPRLNTDEIATLLPSRNTTTMDTTLYKSVFPTTFESRRDYRLRNYWKDNISTVVQSVGVESPLPSEDLSSNFANIVPSPDPQSGLVELVGVITGRRQMSRTLLFADIMPVDCDGNVLLEKDDGDRGGGGSSSGSSSSSSSGSSSGGGDSSGGSGGGGGSGSGSTSSGGGSSSSSSGSSGGESGVGYQVARYAWTSGVGVDQGSELKWIQLIVGKTIRNTLGQEAAAAICKGVKVGQVVRVQGRLSDQLGAAKVGVPVNASGDMQYKALEMAVHHVDVLFDGKKTVFPPQTQKRGSSPLPLNWNEPLSAATAAAAAGGGGGDGILVHCSVPSVDSQIMPESSPSSPLSPPLPPPLPPLSLPEASQLSGELLIGGTDHPLPTPQYLELMEVVNLIGDSNLRHLSDHEVMAAIVVDDRKGLQTLEGIISAVEMDSAAAVVALDCEWKPSGMYDRSDDSAGKKGVDNPVAVLQVATRRGLVIIDMQTLAGDSSDASDRATLNSCLTRIMANSKIMKLGFEVGQDLRKLMTSFPALDGLHDVSNVMDIKRLGQVIMRIQAPSKTMPPAAVPPPAPTTVSSLTNLCRRLLGKGLNKSQQCSPWHVRPLTADQVT